jgi:hypothetical protein
VSPAIKPSYQLSGQFIAVCDIDIKMLLNGEAGMIEPLKHQRRQLLDRAERTLQVGYAEIEGRVSGAAPRSGIGAALTV